MAATNNRNGPLVGIRILDLTRALAGPFATLLLGGLGATVVRLEQPGGDGRENAPFLGRDGVALKRLHDDDIGVGHLIRHRGKQSITLNLKHPEAPALFARLVPHFDVVVENYTRGTAERLGVGYSAASAAKPDIVYCSISGFGQEGAPGGGKAMDGIIQALSGIMMTSGSPGDPPVRIGVPFADLNTPLFAVIGIIAALYHRAMTGEGQHIDVSMLGALSSLQAIEPFKLLEDLGVPMRTGATVPRLTPFGVYPTANGNVAICCSGDRNFARLVEAMERPDLGVDPRFATQVERIQHYADLDAIVGGWTSGLTTDAVVRRLEAAGIAAAPVRSPDEANRDARVLARGEVVRLGHPVHGETADVFGPGLPITFSRTATQITPLNAQLGEHNDAVFGDLIGLTGDERARLKREGAI